MYGRMVQALIMQNDNGVNQTITMGKQVKAVVI